MIFDKIAPGSTPQVKVFGNHYSIYDALRRNII
jgi:hypothetical protein